jgi:PEP-CTERM motif
MNLKLIALGAVAVSAVAAATAPANATIALGDDIQLNYLFPDTSSVYQTNSTTFTGDGTSLPIIYTGTAYFNTDLIDLVQNFSSYYDSASFNGVEITDVTNPSAFADWVVLPGTTTAPITEYQSGGSIYVNWEGAPTTGVVLIGPQVPEASTWAMMMLGFAGLGLLGHRKAKSVRTAFSSA